MNEQSNMQLSSLLKKRIMRNVYGVWFMRLLAPIVFFEIPALFVLGMLAARFIFVQRVLENMTSSAGSIDGFFRFLASAIVHTHPETQIVLGLSMGVGIFFAKDIFRSVRGIGVFLK